MERLLPEFHLTRGQVLFAAACQGPPPRRAGGAGVLHPSLPSFLLSFLLSWLLLSSPFPPALLFFSPPLCWGSLCQVEVWSRSRGRSEREGRKEAVSYVQIHVLLNSTPPAKPNLKPFKYPCPVLLLQAGHPPTSKLAETLSNKHSSDQLTVKLSSVRHQEFQKVSPVQEKRKAEMLTDF